MVADMANLAFFFALIFEFGLKLLVLWFDFGNEDFLAVSSATDRKSVVLGQSVDLGARRIITNNTFV